MILKKQLSLINQKKQWILKIVYKYIRNGLGSLRSIVRSLRFIVRSNDMRLEINKPFFYQTIFIKRSKLSDSNLLTHKQYESYDLKCFCSEQNLLLN